MTDTASKGLRFEIKVLSLVTATDRRARMRTMLDSGKAGPWSFFDARPASELTMRYDEIETFRKYGSVMSTGEISCAVSHIAIMTEFVGRDDLDYVVVLEDDVFLDPTFDTAATVQALELMGIGYFKLYARFFVPASYIASFGRAQLYRFAWPPCGTQGYILSKVTAREMLAAIARRPSLDLPIDQMMDRYWETGIPIYGVYPFPLMELNVTTSIHTTAQRGPMDRRNRELQVTEQRGLLVLKQAALREKLTRRRADLSFRAPDRRIQAVAAAHQNEIIRLLN